MIKSLKIALSKVKSSVDTAADSVVAFSSKHPYITGTAAALGAAGVHFSRTYELSAQVVGGFKASKKLSPQSWL